MKNQTELSTPFEVAVDTTAAQAGPGGIGRYARSVIEKIEGNCGFLINRFSGLDVIHVGTPSIGTGVDPLLVPESKPKLTGGLRRVLNSYLFNSYLTTTRSPRVYWGPAHRLPISIPKKTRAVLTIHDLCWRTCPNTMRGTTRSLDAMLMPAAIKRSSVVVTTSRSVERELINEWPSLEGKISVIPLASSLPCGVVHPLPSSLPSEQYFLFVGTYEPRKNIDRLLLAYAYAGEGDSSWPGLVICGAPGWGGVDPAAEAARLGISDRVEVRQLVSDSDLATLYRHALCLVMPSIYEGFGLPLVEAMAQGTPVLTSDCASMPEVAGNAGLFVNPFSIESIADGLRTIATDDKLRETLALNASLRAQRFSWGRAAADTWDVLMNAAEL